jgi:UDP-glucose 4-epimerase
MSILITGGAGYIGSQIAWTLRDRNPKTRIIVLDNYSNSYPCNLPEDVVEIFGDIGDSKFVESILRRVGVSTIVHCAASLSVPHSIRTPLHYYENNVSASLTLIQAAIETGVKHFVFSSTSAVYGQPEFSRPMKEDDPLRPLSPYGWSKMMVEQILKDTVVAHKDFNYAILRSFNVAGADPLMRTGPTDQKSGALFRRAAMAALGRIPYLEVHGTDYNTPDGTAIRDYVHVADVADAHVRALQFLNEARMCLTLNVGYGRGFSVLDVKRAMEQCVGATIPVLAAPRRAGDPEKVISDPTILQALFHWHPKYEDLTKIATHTLEWEKRLDPERA